MIHATVQLRTAIIRKEPFLNLRLLPKNDRFSAASSPQPGKGREQLLQAFPTCGMFADNLRHTFPTCGMVADNLRHTFPTCGMVADNLPLLFPLFFPFTLKKIHR